MQRREHDRLTHPGRRQSDRRSPLADHRRVLLVGIDEDWRYLTSYLFEDAGYTAYAARDAHQAAGFMSRLLPDVVVVQMAEPDGLDVLMRLPRDPNADVPVVVLVESLRSAHAQHVRALGGVPLAPDPTDVNALVGEVDTLIVVAARGPRALNRRLLDLQELASYYSPDSEGKAQLRRLIDHLQFAIFAVDEQGQCIAASEGLTTLTGYSRLQLLSRSVFEFGFVRGHRSGDRRRGFLADRQFRRTTTIITQAGDDVAVHAAAIAEILPGFHVAAFAATDLRPQRHLAAFAATDPRPQRNRRRDQAADRSSTRMRRGPHQRAR